MVIKYSIQGYNKYKTLIFYSVITSLVKKKKNVSSHS